MAPKIDKTSETWVAIKEKLEGLIAADMQALWRSGVSERDSDHLRGRIHLAREILRAVETPGPPLTGLSSGNTTPSGGY